MKHKRLFLIIIILIILIFILNTSNKNQKMEDILFLKLLSNPNLQNDNNINSYEFKVRCKNADFRSINLIETTNNKRLINEKIAPGTDGEFKIILKSNKNLLYKIKFLSKNDKPSNFKFKAYKNNNIIAEDSKLENLSYKLTGEIKKDETIEIKIYWYWDYNINEKEDNQDTNDAQRIRKYKFDIQVVGEEVK